MENESRSRLEALNVENDLLHQNLLIAKEEFKLEAKNKKLRDELARKYLRQEVPWHNFLAQLVSRSPKPIAQLVLWLAYYSPLYFVMATYNTLTVDNNFKNFIDLLTGNSIVLSINTDNLIEILTIQQSRFLIYNGLLFYVLLWLTFSILRWYYKGSASTANWLLILIFNPFLPLALYIAIRLSYTFSYETSKFYLALSQYKETSLSYIIKLMGFSPNFSIFCSKMLWSLVIFSVMTFFAVLLNKKVQTLIFERPNISQ